MVAVHLFFKIKRDICYALHLVRALHIESVFSLSYKKMWKFSRTKDERMTLTPCLFMAREYIGFQCVLSPYHSGVGIGIVYFRSGFSTTFL